MSGSESLSSDMFSCHVRITAEVAACPVCPPPLGPKVKAQLAAVRWSGTNGRTSAAGGRPGGPGSRYGTPHATPVRGNLQSLLGKQQSGTGREPLVYKGEQVCRSDRARKAIAAATQPLTRPADQYLAGEMDFCNYRGVPRCISLASTQPPRHNNSWPNTEGQPRLVSGQQCRDRVVSCGAGGQAGGGRGGSGQDDMRWVDHRVPVPRCPVCFMINPRTKPSYTTLIRVYYSMV